MLYLRIALQLFVALGVLNVWLLRANNPSAYRGGNARNLHEEFPAYGLPAWSMYLVGAIKILLALALIVGMWFPLLVRPAAIGMGLMMLGAVAMHLKIKDPLHKSLPAAGIAFLCALIVFLCGRV
ncbi:MAG: DoxX family protein [Verrucomicrobiota bacterium]|nr:DoxX family protein [Verrucomicrobiota bacterium]